jgi:uncharacterized protein YjfI (DUF2170 family)
MNENFLKVKNYLTDLGFEITLENRDEGVLIVQNYDYAVTNLVIGVADPLVIIEQYLFSKSNADASFYKTLLMKNQDIIHGAFVIDETGEKILFRDTLQVENLDVNELEATINSLSLLLSEYSDELIEFSMN